MGMISFRNKYKQAKETAKKFLEQEKKEVEKKILKTDPTPVEKIEPQDLDILKELVESTPVVETVVEKKAEGKPKRKRTKKVK